MNFCFSQKKYNWKDIHKTELFSFSENEYCNNIESKNLTADFLISSEERDFASTLIGLKEPKFDVLLEKKCLILRVHFSNRTSDFIIYREQGILIDLNNPIVLLQLEHKSEFNKVLKKYSK